jgi:hypothetical protein
MYLPSRSRSHAESQRFIDGLQHLFNDIFDADTLKNGFDCVQRAAPLHATLVFGRGDDNTMRIYFASCKGNKRRRDVIKAMKRSEYTFHVSMNGNGLMIDLLHQYVKVSGCHGGNASCDGSVHPHEDEDIVQICSDFRADSDLSHS